MIAYLQEHSCHAHRLGKLANAVSVTGLEEDSALIKALVEWSGHKPAQIAARIGAANTTINRPFKGTAESRISRATMLKLQEQYPRFPGFVAEEDADDQQYVNVNVLPSYAGGGGGGTGEGSRSVAKLPRRLIEEELRGKPADFELIDVRGDSMMPDFHHGDQILIDRRDRDPRQPGPFALWDDDGYVVKLVERVPSKRGWYRIFSANDRYSPYEVEESETTIMGRPVWFARRL